MSVNIQITQPRKGPKDNFIANITGAKNAEEAQIAMEESDEELAAFIVLDPDDAGVQAIANVLRLAVEANRHPRDAVCAENLLLEIFMAGRRSAQQE